MIPIYSMFSFFYSHNKLQHYLVNIIFTFAENIYIEKSMNLKIIINFDLCIIIYTFSSEKHP